MANFKGIIKNMAETTATEYAEVRSGKFFEVVEGTFSITNGSKDVYPMWNMEIREIGDFLHDYRIAGYVSDYGNVVICSVIYIRTYCDEDGNNRHTETKCLSGKEMEAFGFDK